VAKLSTDHSSFDAGDVQQGPGSTYQPGAGNQDARTKRRLPRRARLSGGYAAARG
jgi:hypothetical protein